MRELKLLRFEGKYAICTDQDQRFFAIEIGELPKELRPGNRISIDDQGIITLMQEPEKKKTGRIR